MRCPKCGCDNDKVIDSRSFGDGSGVRRRRECSGCAYRFTTLEEIVPEELKVIKRNGVREDYNSDKLRTGIRNACYKRPVSDDEIDRIVEEINHTLLRDFEKEVPSLEIGERVMAALKVLDQVAYVRFASVYKNFTDLDSYTAEINNFDVSSGADGEG